MDKLTVRVRLNPFSDRETKHDYTVGDNLYEVVTEILEVIGFKGEHLKLFHVVVNGTIIDDFELLQNVLLKQDDDILITPAIKGGDFGQTFKQVAVIAVAATVGYYTAGQGYFLSAGLTAGATIGSSLLLNSLIPPPQPPGLGSLGSLGSSGGLESSQMYTLGGQSNQTKRFGVVPKVYGTFRMFANVAANPYVDVEVDRSTGNIVQVLHAIYDFGLGPMLVDDLKIGETLITDFDDVEFNLVDPNKPTVSTGFWDDQLKKTFTLYKGDVSTENVAFEFTQNLSDVGASAGNYEVIRTGPVNPDNLKQEINVILTFPQGLSSVKVDGERGFLEIEFQVQFRRVGTTTWLDYNNLTYVENFAFTGQANDTTTVVNSLAPYGFIIPNPPPSGNQLYQALPNEILLGSFNGGLYDPIVVIPGETPTYDSRIVQHIGHKAGTNIINALYSNAIQVGQDVYYYGTFLGKIAAIGGTDLGSPAGAWRPLTLDRPLPIDVITSVVEYVETLQQATPGAKTVNVRESRGFQFQFAIAGRAYVADDRSVNENANTQQFASIKFSPRVNGQYEVRVRRRNTLQEFTYAQQDRAVLQSITTRFDQNPIQTKKRHVFLELKIRATNQLNGTIDNLNAVCTSALEVYDDSSETWSYELTSNPAWVITDLLIGQVNKRPIGKDRLDLDSLVEFADYADEIPTTPSTQTNPFVLPRFQTNFILDFETNLKDLISLVGSSCQASLNITEGKYGVLIDQLKTVPVQIFTPRNYNNFQSTRNYGTNPDAIEVKFNDPAKNFQLSSEVVYDDGFSSSNATEIEELESFGITNPEQAWRYGKYNLAQNKLRQEKISITVDFEYLVCTRGDYVQFTQDSMAAGGTPARVKSVSGNRILIDDGISTTVGPQYGYVFRASDGSIATDTLTVVDSDEFDLDGTLPAVGDLIIIGIVDSIVVDCIVQSIIPQDNLTATLVLVEKADGVFDALETGVVPDYVPQALVSTDTTRSAPGEVEDLSVDENSFFYQNGYVYYIDLSWSAPIGAAVELYEIYVDSGFGYQLFDNTTSLSYRYILPDEDALGTEHDFKVLAVSANGLKLNLGEVGFVSATPIADAIPPADVTNFNINVTNQVITLNWTLVDDDDVQFYLIRYNPTLTGTWFTSTRLTETDRNTNTVSVQARVGTYLIKAYDFAGNESDNATIAVTSIPELFGLNLIEELNDRPNNWPGEKDLVDPQISALILRQTPAGDYYSEGFYYLEEFLDLGEIYTVRLQNYIEAEGYREGDLMSSWTTLAAIDPIASTTTSDWDVQAEVRYRESLTVMSNWSPLSDVLRLDEGDIDEWSPWTQFVVGDFTGRLFQFRIKFTSNVVDVTPRVTDGRIVADMPERAEQDDNIVSGVGTYSVTYANAFAGPGTTPNIQITLDSGATGDYWIITNKSLEGFDITFYDSTDTVVSRTFDYYAVGYGRKNATVIF